MIKKWSIILVSLLLLAACQSEGVNEKVITETIEENGLNIYLVNGNNDALVEVSVEVDKSSVDTQIEDVIYKLLYGDEVEGLKGTIPDVSMVDGFDLLDRGVRLHVTQSFVEMDEVALLICRSSLIKSLTAIEGVSYIEFYVDGLPLKDDNGKVYGAFYPEDIITASNYGDAEVQIKNAILYFPDTQGETLIKVNRQLELRAGESLEKRLIMELTIPEDTQAVISSLPEGTEVKNIQITNGICYVDFNEVFRTNHYGGSTGEMMTVYSIVNTLTELPNISRVQFLIEGEKTADFKGHLDFSELFEYNIKIVGKD